MSYNPQYVEINDIMDYNGNKEEFKKFQENLDQPINFPTIYDKKNGNKIYTGNIVNDKYEERGILYDDSGKIKYNGYFKEGEYDGFGQLYNNDELIYEGFFINNNYNGKGNLYKNGKIIYEGHFKNGVYEGIGIEYLSNGKRKRKSKFSKGKILNECQGVLYGENEEEIYKGILKNGIPEEGKDLIIYDEYDYIIYKGDFSSFKYNGNGILFYEKSYNKFCEGNFKDGIFIYGISYDPEGQILYKGDFKNNFPKEGQNIQQYELNGYLKYEGDFLNFNYQGYGKLYILTSFYYLLYEGEFINLFEARDILYEKYYKKYEGLFKNGKFNGLGKIYEIDDNDSHYLYYEGNFIDNKIWGKGVKFYVNGSKKIEGIFENIYSYEGKYYNPLNKEIFNGKIKNEITMDFKNMKNMILYNDLGYKVYDCKIYNDGYIKDKNKSLKKDAQNNIQKPKIFIISFVSCGYPPG